MNTVRPRPYPQRGTGAYNANNGELDKDGRNSNGQQQQQNQQTIARGRAEDVQQVQGETRAEINSPAQNAYPQRQAYPVQTPPSMRAGSPIPINQVNPQQYQALQAQAGYQAIPQQSSIQSAQPSAPQRSNRINPTINSGLTSSKAER